MGAEVRAKRAKGDLPKIRERIFWSASPRLVMPSNFFAILKKYPWYKGSIQLKDAYYCSFKSCLIFFFYKTALEIGRLS